MTASSWKPGYYPYAARLYRSTGSGSWCAAAAKKDEYLQVDLGTQYNLVKIGLQGDAASGSGVKRFYIAYSGNGGKWTDYMIHGVAKVGRGGGVCIPCTLPLIYPCTCIIYFQTNGNPFN